MDHSQAEHLIDIFRRHKITITEVRVKLLDIVVFELPEQFSINDLRECVKAKGFNISEAGIISNLQLFVARGILRPSYNSVPVKKLRIGQMGRPESVFTRITPRQQQDDY